MAIYVQIEGIDGDVTAPGHEKWINCSSMSWGVSRMINTPVGNVSERESSTPTIQDVTITTEMDKTAPLLAKAAATTTGKKVTIHLMQTGQDQPQCYMEYILSDALVSSYQVSTSADSKPTESISLNFVKLEMKYTVFDKANNPTENIPAGYDLETGKPI